MEHQALRSGLLGIALALLVEAAAFPLDISVNPGVNLPIGPRQSDGTKLYTFGGGASLCAEHSFPKKPPFFAQALVGYDLLGTASDTALSLVSAGGGIGAKFAPLPVLDLRAAATTGYALSIAGEAAGSNLFLAADAGAAYRPVPFLSLGAGLAYRHYWQLPDPSAAGSRIQTLLSGVSVYLGTTFHLGALRQRSRLQIPQIELPPVFPVFYRYYDTHPVGSLRILNDERGPISEIQVSFFAPQYMDQPKPSEPIAELARGQEIEAPLYALFTDEIVTVTEGTKVAAQIRVQYKLAGADMQTEVGQTLEILQRNAMTWDDDRKAASFVTSNDPGVQKYAKAIAGFARAEGGQAVGLAFRQALGIFESLGLYGVNYVADPKTPYVERSRSDTAIDTLQFPIDTLGGRAGDCDDLSILYAALLQSVAVETAFITVPGHIFVAFALDQSLEEVKMLFVNPQDLIVREGVAWVPVEVTMIPDGFLKAWQEGARQWREHSAANAAAFYPIREAWSTYPATKAPSSADNVEPPRPPDFAPRYASALQRFVDLQIRDRVLALQEAIRKSNKDPRQVNKLGVLYAQFGLYDKAEEQLKAAAAANNIAAIVNLANLYYLRKDMRQAAAQYERALARDAGNPTILLGLAKANYELENYGSVRELYSRLQARDPQLAARFSYLGSKDTDGTRASDAGLRQAVVWDER